MKKRKRSLHEQAKEKRIRNSHLPQGISVLLTYTILLAIVYFFLGLAAQANIFFGKIITGQLAVFLNLVIVVYLGVLCHGFYRAERWAYYATFVFEGFSIINALICLPYLSKTALNTMLAPIALAFIISIVLNAIIIWYVHVRKAFFFQKHHDPRLYLSDKIFISSIYLFYFFMILVFLIVSLSLYGSASDIADHSVIELNEVDLNSGAVICSEKMGRSRDVCFLSLVVIHSSEGDLRFYCDRVYSDFYRFSCYQAAMMKW